MAIIQQSLVDTITVKENLIGVTGELLVHRLTLKESWTPSKAKALSDKLTLTESLTYNTLSTYQLTDILSTNSSFTPIVVNDTFVGSVIPTITPANEFLIWYPWDRDGYPDIILPPPEFQDTENYRPIRVNRYSRNNSLNLFEFDYWGYEWIFDYKFTNINPTVENQLRIFLHAHVGEKVRILDHVGLGRIGVILDPGTGNAENQRSRFSTSFRFQQLFEDSV